MMTMPNAEIGGVTPAELKYGTRDHARFQLPPPLSPGHSYGDLVIALDRNLSVVRSITSSYQQTLRLQRLAKTPTHNKYQPGDYLLWNPLQPHNRFDPPNFRRNFLGPTK
jgi:hypothetical protein